MKNAKNKNIPLKDTTDKGSFSAYLPKLFKFNRIRKLILKKVNGKD